MALSSTVTRTADQWLTRCLVPHALRLSMPRPTPSQSACPVTPELETGDLGIANLSCATLWIRQIAGVVIHSDHSVSPVCGERARPRRGDTTSIPIAAAIDITRPLAHCQPASLRPRADQPIPRLFERISRIGDKRRGRVGRPLSAGSHVRGKSDAVETGRPDVG
jgi:hypothetical protein